jgi:ABC-type multidrug transport system ATPase subunit
MGVFQYCWAKKYIKYARNMDIVSSVDNLLMMLLKNFSVKRVDNYKFRGILAKQQTCTIEFRGLGTSLKPPSGLAKLYKSGPSEKKTVLKGVSGEFVPRRVSAILGPSGAGKTTFLNVLCGKTRNGNQWEVYGKVMINGLEKQVKDLKPVTGFVPQDDVVHEHMTVRENIRFSAVLRNARGTKRGRIKRITNDVLQVLQLVPNQNMLVGDRVRGGGLSGGQRKRVNVGLELAACPTLLFLDEPTSGLDSTSSLLLVQQLRKMCQLGMTIVMVIHQPRYSLFTLIDDVLLLGKGGSTVYVGPTNEAKAYFERLGFYMPSNENPADWMMDVMSGQVVDEGTSSQIRKAELPEALFRAWESQGQDFMRQQSSPASPSQELSGRPRPRALTEGRLLEGHEDQDLIKHHIKEHWRKFAPDGHSLFESEFVELLKSCTGLDTISDDVVLELMRRMAGEAADEISQQQFTKCVLEFQGVIPEHLSVQNMDLEDEQSDDYSDSDSDSSDEDDEETADDEDEISPMANGQSPHIRNSRGTRITRVDRADLQRRQPGFVYQTRVELHRRSLVWWRNQALLALFLGVVLVAALVLGLFDAFVFKSPKWFPTGFLNAHISLALLISVYSLGTFSEDQPVFWRESSHGLNRLSFLIGRTVINTIDWFMMAFLFTSVYFLITAPRINYFAWSLPDFLVAWVASGWGYCIAAFLPRELGPFVAAVLMFSLGGILGLPDKMGIFLDGGALEASVSVLSFTRWSVPMSFLSYTNLFPPNVTELDQLESSQLQLSREFYSQSDWLLPGGERDIGYWYTGTFALFLMGFALRCGAYLGLVLINRGKQV